MKSRIQLRSPSFHTYLKPGALAQIRYSKITAKSKEIDTQVLRQLKRIQSGSGTVSLQSMDGFPCFGVRVSGFTRCIGRKKLVATKPYFTETQLDFD